MCSSCQAHQPVPRRQENVTAQRTPGVTGLHPQPVQHKPPLYCGRHIMSPCCTAAHGAAQAPSPPAIRSLLTSSVAQASTLAHYSPHCTSPAALVPTAHTTPSLSKSCYTSAQRALYKPPCISPYGPSTQSLRYTRFPSLLPASCYISHHCTSSAVRAV